MNAIQGAAVVNQAAEQVKADTRHTATGTNNATDLNSAENVQANKDVQPSTTIASDNADKDIPKISAKQLEVVAQKLQDFVSQMNRGLEFSVDEDSGRDVIKVIDKNSGELVKQFPSEEVLDLVANLSEATGNFINSKV